MTPNFKTFCLAKSLKNVVRFDVYSKRKETPSETKPLTKILCFHVQVYLENCNDLFHRFKRIYAANFSKGMPSFIA